MAIINIRFGEIPVSLVGEDFFSLLDVVKSCDNREFNPSTKIWTIQPLPENYLRLKQFIIVSATKSLIEQALAVKTTFQAYDLSKYPLLYEFQRAGVNELLNGKKLLADEVGLGKTVQAMVYAMVKKYAKTLIVCPAPLKKQWKIEIKKFLKYEALLIEGNKKEREELLQDDKHKFVIVNYEQLRLHSFNNFDLIIFDEIHRLKNNRSKTFKSACLINCRDKLGLTATPFVNNPLELFTICKFLGWQVSWQNFNNNFCIWEPVNTTRGVINIITGYKSLGELHNRLQPLMCRRKKVDVLPELPARVFKNYYVEAEKEQKNIIRYYERSAKNFFLNDDLHNVLAYLTLARMACDSTELIMKSDSGLRCKVESINSCKLEVLKDIISQVEGKIIIFSQWAKMVEIIARELGNCVFITGDTKDKQKAIDDFKNSDAKVLVCSDVLNYGFNLQFCSVIIHFDLPWSSAKIEQREGRIDRIGSKNSILVFKLLVRDSIEDHVVSLLEDKTSLFNTVIEGNDTSTIAGLLKVLFRGDKNE